LGSTPAWAILALSEGISGMRAFGQVVVNAQPVAQAEGPVLEEDTEEEAVVQPGQRVWVMTDDQFDQWVFGAPRNPRGGRNKLDSLLTLHVDDVARICHLTEAQKRKLLLAGRGDIKRFFEKVDEKRKKFEKVKTDQNKIGEIYQELVPLQTFLQSGLFSQGSFYDKTLRTILSQQDQGACQARVEERNQFRYRAKIELVVTQLDQSVGFRADQRRRLIEHILSETQPPKRYGQYDYYIVLYQASKVPADKLKPLFEERQWALLQRSLNQGRGMEHFLRAQGLLPARAEGDVAVEFVKALRPQLRVGPALPADVFAPAPDK
jgi:hypothetical protein